MSDRPPQATILKILLAIGFCGFAGGILIAHSRPATGYELSLYQSTPLAAWVGLVAAGILGLVASFVPVASRGVRTLGYALTTSAVMAVFALPIIRGYFYYGAGDSMTHLGWARELEAATGSAFGFIYPAVHSLAVYLSVLSGFELTYTLQFVPLVVFPLMSVVFMTFCVQYLTDSRWAVPVGLATGLLLVPINNLSIHLMAHPSSQAVLFLPFILYLVFRFVNEQSDRFAFATPTGLALAIGCLTLVFIHPQEAMSLALLLGAIAVVQFSYRRFRPTDRIAHHRPIYAHALLTFLVFATWLPQHDRPLDRIAFVLEQFQAIGATTGGEAEAQTASLAALGGSIEELFVKLMGVTLIIGLAAAVLIGLNLLGWLENKHPDRSALVTYLTAGLVPISAVFLVVFIADQGDHYFRFMGFLMVSVTILGASAIAAAASRASLSFSRNAVVWGVILLFGGMLVMQTLAVHPSPYYYQSNNQVTESSMDGYEVAFEHRNEETAFTAVRDGPRRFVDAYYGRPTARESMDFPGYRTGVNETAFNEDLASFYESDQYLAIREANRKNEIELYEELRFSQSGFDRLEAESNIYRLQDNGDFTLYLLRNEE